MKEEIRDKIAVLIPTLNPNDKLIMLVEEMKKSGINKIIIIDDGSKKECKEIFDKLDNCTIYHHEVNKGKGAALKTGIQNIIKNEPDLIGVVTADSDGQHCVKDIKRMQETLFENQDNIILGVRKFNGKNVPITSKIGNGFSSFYFKLMTGVTLKDTQTGLRAIPKRYFDFSLEVEGQRYDYEMRFLEKACENKIKFFTIEIETIYEEKHVTQFRFIKDSIIIYKTLLKSFFTAITSAALDVTLFMIFNNVLGKILLSTIFARLISGGYNFTLNKVWTFEKKSSKNLPKQIIGYLILFVIQMFVSGIVTDLLDKLLGAFIGLVFIKIVVDVVIFFVNFLIQKKFIFN